MPRQYAGLAAFARGSQGALSLGRFACRLCGMSFRSRQGQMGHEMSKLHMQRAHLRDKQVTKVVTVSSEDEPLGDVIPTAFSASSMVANIVYWGSQWRLAVAKFRKRKLPSVTGAHGRRGAPKRRRYTIAFKSRAVDAASSSTSTMGDIAAGLQVPQTTLCKWIKDKDNIKAAMGQANARTGQGKRGGRKGSLLHKLGAGMKCLRTQRFESKEWKQFNELLLARCKAKRLLKQAITLMWTRKQIHSILDELTADGVVLRHRGQQEQEQWLDGVSPDGQSNAVAWQNSLTLSQRRVLLTMWCGEGYKQWTTHKYDLQRRRAFETGGCGLTKHVKSAASMSIFGKCANITGKDIQGPFDDELFVQAAHPKAIGYKFQNDLEDNDEKDMEEDESGSSQEGSSSSSASEGI